MEINELKIGNYVKFYDPINGINIYKVYDIYDSGSVSLNDKGRLASCTVKDIEPIELTEEVLVKIGFKKKNDCYVLQNEYIFFVYYKDSFKQELLASAKRKGKYYYNTNELKNYDIKYLHELQNAYYCLTGEELEVEL